MDLPQILEPPRGRVLVIAPHPDDESCGLGGTIALHRRQDDPVHLLFVTDGTSGDPDERIGDVASTRRAEACAAADVLGGCEVKFLGLPDGHEVSESDLRMGEDLFALALEEAQPDLVYVPWEGEAHSDHATSCRVLNRLLGRRTDMRPRVLEYEVWSPLPADWIVDITETAEVKRQAMLAHASQCAYTDYPHQLMGLAAHRSLYLPKASRYGEAFREARGLRS